MLRHLPLRPAQLVPPFACTSPATRVSPTRTRLVKNLHRRQTGVRSCRVRRPGWFLTILLVLVGAFVFLGGYYLLARGDSEPRGLSLDDLVDNSDPGPIHVHGLGLNPADRRFGRRIEG